MNLHKLINLKFKMLIFFQLSLMILDFRFSFNFKIIFFFPKDEISQSWQSCDRCSTFFPTAILLSRHKVQNHFHQMVSNKKSYMNTTNARKKLLEQHQLIRRNIEKAKQVGNFPRTGIILIVAASYKTQEVYNYEAL